MRFIYLIAVFLILISCQNEDRFIIKAKEDSLVLKWKGDSVGCLKYRNENLLDSLFIKYDLAKADIERIKFILGKPNNEYENEKYLGLRYYYNSICLDNNIAYDADKCWLEILVSFSVNEKNTIGRACE